MVDQREVGPLQVVLVAAACVAVVAAAVVVTILLPDDLEAVVYRTPLAIIVLIRTFLSFTLELELTGRWPWQLQASRNPTDRNSAVGG